MTYYVGLLRSEGFLTEEAFRAKTGKVLGKQRQGSHHRACASMSYPLREGGFVGFERKRKNLAPKNKDEGYWVWVCSGLWRISQTSFCSISFLQETLGCRG